MENIQKLHARYQDVFNTSDPFCYQKILKTSVMYCWGSTTPLCKVNKLIILGWREALTLTIIIKVGTLENIPIENSVSF